MTLTVGSKLPMLEGASKWFNGEPSSEVLTIGYTIIHFWSISCPACKANIPDLYEIKSVINQPNVHFVAIHLPRCEEDTRIEKVEEQIRFMDIQEPCAIDNLHEIGKRFEMDGLWPYYFFFVEGKLRRRAAGALGINLIRNSLRDAGLLSQPYNATSSEVGEGSAL